MKTLILVLLAAAQAVAQSPVGWQHETQNDALHARTSDVFTLKGATLPGNTVRAL